MLIVLPSVSCRSLVDRCGSLGSCKPLISFFIININSIIIIIVIIIIIMLLMFD